MSKLSGVGIFSGLLLACAPGEVADRAAEIDELGYTSLWVPSRGAASFERVEQLLGATRDLVVGTGILHIWTATADETAAADARLRSRYGDRFVLGLGVGHADILGAMIEDASDPHPLDTMERFLDGLDLAARPVAPEARVLAALGPKMLELAGRRTGGAHPYNVTPEHTATARRILGPRKLLIPEQAVALTTDGAAAREMARAFLEHYLQRPNYTNNLRRLGFTDDDLRDGGSDRVVDALVAWGDVDAIAARVQAHLDAGADSVCVQVVTPGGIQGMTRAPADVWRELAPALTTL